MRPRGLPYGRLELLWVFLYGAALVLMLRLFQLQVLESAHYLKASERNRVQTIPQTAPRGRIFDRQGRILATSLPAFSALFMPESHKDPAQLKSLSAALSRELERPPEEIAHLLSESVRNEAPTRLKENLSRQTVFRLSELRFILPGVNLVEEARRHYPFGPFASHLLGYMGKMDPASWEILRRRGYRADAWIGRAGLEKIFEEDLRGQDGGIQLEVDAQGRLKGLIRRQASRPGKDFTLTLDRELQRTAEEALRASVSGLGAAVVLDPRDGAVLALASIPDFDPNWFVLPKEAASAEALKGLPEFNLALQGTYAPGSTFKIVTAAAALNEAKVLPTDRFFCPGYFQMGRRVFLCWEPKGHGSVDFMKGLTHSCDVYFYNLGLKAGGEVLERYEKLFRLGLRTNVILTGEAAGNVFGPEYRKGRRMAWYDGDTLNLAIGQGELLVTPIQMAMLVSAAANRGALYRPQFIQRIQSPDGQVFYERKPELLGRVELKDSTWGLLDEGLHSVVKEGTGRGALVAGLEVAGKTGTSQTQGKDNAWFVSYASLPGEPPFIAMVVLVQHGGHGAESAVPVARRILQTALAARRGTGPPPQADAGVPWPAAFPAVPVPVGVPR